ncbi:hypothetical protein [Streptomyces sp. CB03238]|uniref:hypothetical protein n=1 Tax=Streptomyces sp. CB03238 TaxID=1907777 RepID=UPI000A10C893|nr:hypothetical protein [Streptomyces sp. CB03238]ORT57351.1 hypothetical protein BKD26_24115 [Streptomyces sp. CB03238]
MLDKRQETHGAHPVRLDHWLPGAHWRTHHERAVAAPVPEVARALKEVTFRETRLLRPLMTLRTLPSRLLGHSDGKPFAGDADAIEGMKRMGFIVLDDVPGGELVTGFVGQPWKPSLLKAVVPGLSPEEFLAFDRPGYVKGVTGLWAEPDGAGARLRTETRVYATDPGAARRFTPYWVFIEPFSSLIRRDLLAAVGRRAERAAPGGPGGDARRRA